MIEFDAAYREMLFVVKETAGNAVNAERPDFPFFRFNSDLFQDLRVLTVRRSYVDAPKEIFL
jgi:hypothetical protein